MSNNFRSLVIYEYRKLFRRKIVWITLAVMTAVCIFAGCSRLLGDNYAGGLFKSAGYSFGRGFRGI